MLQNYLKSVYVLVRTLEKLGCVVRPTISHGNGNGDDEFKYVVMTFRVDCNNKTYYLDFRNSRDKVDGTFTVPSSVALYSSLPDLKLLVKEHFNMDFGTGFSPVTIDKIAGVLCGVLLTA